MRIALVHDLPAGGALRFLRETTSRSATEHRYTLFTASGSEPDRSLVRAVDDVIEVRGRGHRRGRAGEFVEFFAAQHAIARAIDKGNVDVVLVHPSQVTQAPPVLTSLRTTPSLYYMHEVRRRTYERGYQSWITTRRGPSNWPRSATGHLVQRGFGVVDRRATAAATAIAANSIFTVEAIARIHGRQARLCHPGVDLDTFRPRPLTTKPALLSVGALDPTKGHDRAVDAVALLPREQRPALTIVYERSDPVYEGRLRDRAQAKEVELDLRSRISDEELAELYSSARVMIAAAPLEPLGLTVLESIAAGTPVVALRQGGYRETVTDRVNGVLVDADPCSIAQGIVQASKLACGADPTAIRATVSSYWTWDRCVDDLHRALDRVVQR